LRARALLCVSSLIFCGSCATIFGGRYNSIIIGELADSEAKVFLDGKQIGTGPGKYRLKKGVIQLGSELQVLAGHSFILEQKINLNTHPAYLAGDFLLLGLGLIIDVPTGNIYRPNPRKFLIKDGDK
jgi:hypothetical protein